MSEPLPARVLGRAADIAGGVHPLCELLGTSPAELTDWVEGRALPPSTVLIRAIELIVVSDCRDAGTSEAAQRLARLLEPDQGPPAAERPSPSGETE